MRGLTDSEHAAAIRKATKALNDAIAAAARAGIEVSVETLALQSVGSPAPRPILDVRLKRLISP